MLMLILRFAMTAAYRARGVLGRMSGRPASGVHGVVFTPSGQVVLVRLTYTQGWHLPGGGRGRRETARDGVLRELREEIGLRGWDAVEQLAEDERVRGGRREHNTLFLVRGAVHRPRWSLEIAQVGGFDRSDLPADTMPWARAAVELAGARVGLDPQA